MAPRIQPKTPIRLYLTEWREHLQHTVSHEQFTQEAVGARMGINGVKSTYRWELWTREPNHNDARQPDFNTLAAFAEALGIRPIDLLRLPDDFESLDALAAGAEPRMRERLIRVVKDMLAP